MDGSDRNFRMFDLRIEQSEMMRQTFSSPAAAAASSSTVCEHCNKAERLVLHGLRPEGKSKKVCTTCVLRLLPQFFCPTCFTVYNPSQPRSSLKDVVICFKCHSNSHTQCVGHTPPNPYICPLCVSPDSDIFTPRKVPNVDGKTGSSDQCMVIDKSAARILLAAARVAATSMTTVAASLRETAERRVNEAASTRKRAREALEHVSYMAAEERMRRNEALLVQRGIMGGIGSNSVSARNQVENMNNVDKSSEVVAAVNKERVEMKISNNIVHMDVEEDEGLTVAPDSLTGLPIAQNHEDSHENGFAEDIADFDIANDQELSISIVGLGSLPAQEEQDQQTRLVLATEQNNVNLSTV